MPRRSALATPIVALTAFTALTALALGLVGCSSGVVTGPTATPTPTETPVTIVPSGDGTLRIGTVFPSSGGLAFLGPAQVAAVEVAVREINEAGGVNGAPVEVLHRDSGAASVNKIEGAMSDLVARKVDVIIGPSSSVLAQRIIPTAVEAGIAVISPAATLPELTKFDDSGFFFRTIPAYPLQGVALGTLLPESDATDVALIHSDDSSGRSIAESLEATLAENGGVLVASEAIAGGSTDVTSIVTAVSDAKPDAVVIATSSSNPDQIKALVTGLTAAKLGGTKLWLTSQNLADYSKVFAADALTGVNGILEGAVASKAFVAKLTQSDPSVSRTRYAAEAYDATILAALAAVLAKDDSGTSISQLIRSASTGGIKCLSFAECLDVLKTEADIDYDGISGPVDVTADGDVASASYGIFSYGAKNTYSRSSTYPAN